MSEIRINDLPLEGTPSANEFLAIDGATTRKSTIQTVVDAGAPIASQAEAQAGTDASKRMTPLTTKQSIASEVGVTIAGPLGPNLTGIKALTTASNKVPIFIDGGGNSTTYTVSPFVQAASAAVSASDLLAVTGASYPSVTVAQSTIIDATIKQITTKFRAPNFAVPATLTGGANYKRVSLVDLAGYPSECYFRSSDRYLPDGSTDNTNGGYWILDEINVYPEMLGALADGITDDSAKLTATAAFLDKRGGGDMILRNVTYLCENEWTLPCGVNLYGNGATLKYTTPGSNGIYCTTDATRLGQHSKINGVTFGRSGSNGGKAIYTQQSNAPFFTQSPAWIIENNWFRDLGNPYTYPPTPSGGALYAWTQCIEIAHSNGSAIRDNDMIGNFDPTLVASGQFDCGGVRLGTDPNNTNGVIACDIDMNRIWYQKRAFDIGEDVLAFWFQHNECIKCYRGVYAAADPGGDGTVSQADTRIIDNFITTCIGGVDLSSRQLLHIVGNHTNSDPNYFDNGLGFIGINLTNCNKVTLRGNSANLASGHVAWAGDKTAVKLTNTIASIITGQLVSRYFDYGISFEGTTRRCLTDDNSFVQLTKNGYRFMDTVQELEVGRTQYPDALPLDGRYFFASTASASSIYISGYLTRERVIEMFNNTETFKVSIRVDGDGIIFRDATNGVDIAEFASGTNYKLMNLGSTVIRVGPGNPNGSINANPGSLFLSTSGGTGATFYVKETGTGNTGWIAK